MARRNRCLELRKKLAAGEIHSINELITLNLDIWQFARDAIVNCEGPELLRAFWQAIQNITVLDPTCGSGAFLFAALQILESLYSDCLERMQRFVDDLDRGISIPDDTDANMQVREKSPSRSTSSSTKKFHDFRNILSDMAGHASERYFFLKSIIINNLYGVDIMEESVEICKLRLFLKRNATPVQLSKSERDRLHQACADMTVIWRSEASLVERKQIARLLLTRFDVDVQNNSEQVHVTLHWSGGFESVHKIARAVQKFDQLDGYQNLLDRALELTLSGCSAPQVAETLQREGYRCPRQMKAISASTVTRLLLQNPMACKQLNAPDLLPDHWLADDLARRLSMPTKRLKDWVTRGWAIAAQRPHGRVWVISADEQEVERLQALASRQEGQGRPLPPEELRIPLSNSREK